MKREEIEIEQERRKILQDNFVTEINKKKFIDKIKNEWADHINSEPNKIQKKVSFWTKFKKLLGWN